MRKVWKKGEAIPAKSLLLERHENWGTGDLPRISRDLN